jgi:hypothetical protein
LKSLTHFLQHIINGNFCNNNRAFFFGAKLIAIKKKDGGTRPIAIGETLRRLAAKIALENLDFPFTPFQYGIKTKQGTEIIIHKLRRIVEASSNDPSTWKAKAVLKVDLQNAFNNVSRTAFLKIVKYCLPSLFPFVSTCYDSPSHLLFGQAQFISSAEGVQQGDPLGPALFSLVLHTLILKLDEDCDLDLNCWYLDDGVLVGTPDELCKVIDTISSFGAGIHLNPTKCELFALDTSTNLSILPQAFQRSPQLEILGSPITDVIKFSQKRLIKVNDAMEELLNMDHMQSAFILLKHCFGPMKINHLLRTVPPTTEFQEFLKAWDSSHSEILSRIIRYPVSTVSLQQASLPTKFGGLGLRSTHHLALGAFLGSVSSCMSSEIINSKEFTASENNALSLFNKNYKQNLTVSDLQISLASDPHLQKVLTTKAYDEIFSNFFSKLSIQEQIWISNCKHDSTSWFSSPPSVRKGLFLKNTEFQVSILTRIQEKLFNGNLFCLSGSKSSTIDTQGRHCLGCPVGAGTHERHRLVRDAIFSIAKETGLSARLEPLHVLADSPNRPADIYLPSWMSSTQPAALDVSIVVPTRHKPPKNSAENNYTLALDAAYNGKCEKHSEACKRSSMNFVPLIFSAAGSVHEKSLKALHFIADARSQRLNIPLQQGRADLMQKISIAIHKGNAVCILQHGFFAQNNEFHNIPRG